MLRVLPARLWVGGPARFTRFRVTHEPVDLDSATRSGHSLPHRHGAGAALRRRTGSGPPPGHPRGGDGGGLRFEALRGRSQILVYRTDADTPLADSGRKSLD